MTEKHKTHKYLTAATIIAVIAVTVLSSCHGYQRNSAWAQYMAADTAVKDTANNYRHYGTNFNFVVKADSLVLVRQQPEEVLTRMHTDTLTVYGGDHVAVAEIRILPNDSIDSVWVQIARDQQTIGWLHERTMLPSVVPDDPISQFIKTFSDVHLIIFLTVICIIAAAYLLRTATRRKAHIVHLNDIPTFYPTLLALTVAAGAVVYASLRLFADDIWEHFYYHPTLNPLIVPPALGVFLVCVWAMVIIALAAVDVVRSILPPADALLYLCGLAAVCAVNYIVFTVATLYYIGYPLFAAYAVYAVWIYVKRFGRLYKNTHK